MCSQSSSLKLCSERKAMQRAHILRRLAYRAKVTHAALPVIVDVCEASVALRLGGARTRTDDNRTSHPGWLAKCRLHAHHTAQLLAGKGCLLHALTIKHSKEVVDQALP